MHNLLLGPVVSRTFLDLTIKGAIHDSSSSNCSGHILILNQEQSPIESCHICLYFIFQNTRQKGNKGDPNRLKKSQTEKVFEGIQFVFSCY